MNAGKVYRCGECAAVHQFEHDAEDCCAPEIYEQFVCGTCLEYHDEEEMAEDCCSIDGDPERAALTMTMEDVLALEAAGQLRLLP